MSSLEDHMAGLTFSQSAGDVSPNQELSGCNTTSGSMSHLDLFIRDLDCEFGKLPYCQEVTDIQTGVENVLKALLLEVEKENPFYKTTLINSGSYYEGTKVVMPNEFDYFVQLDNFSQAEDIRYEELPYSTMIVLPSESGFTKFRQPTPEPNPFRYDFDWKKGVKAPFVDSLEKKLKNGFEAFGINVLPSKQSLYRHGPAYSLVLQWKGGSRYKGMEISVDLSLAVKINSLPSTIDVDFETSAGKVVKTLLDASPYYFAISTYRERQLKIPPSNLLNEFEEANARASAKRSASSHCEPSSQFTVRKPADCLLRASQSCLEQSLFQHFGADSGQGVCLRVLKILRDLTRPPGVALLDIKFHSSTLIDNFVTEFCGSRLSSESSFRWIFDAYHLSGSFINEGRKNSSRWISSYALKTVVLFEWMKNPDPEEWTASNLGKRLLNMIENLLRCLKCKGMRSFFYKDYNVLPSHDKEFGASLPDAINRVTIIHRYLLAVRSEHNYSNCLKRCIKNFKNKVKLNCQKMKLAIFLHKALGCIFRDAIQKVEVGPTAESSSLGCHTVPLTPSLDGDRSPFLDADAVINIYIQAFLDEIALHENLVLTVLENEAEVKSTCVKQAEELFKDITCSRMKGLDDLPNYSLGTHDITRKPEELLNLLKFFCDNFKNDLESLKCQLMDLK